MENSTRRYNLETLQRESISVVGTAVEIDACLEMSNGMQVIKIESASHGT